MKTKLVEQKAFLEAELGYPGISISKRISAIQVYALVCIAISLEQLSSYYTTNEGSTGYEKDTKV